MSVSYTTIWPLNGIVVDFLNVRSDAHTGFQPSLYISTSMPHCLFSH